MTWFSRSIAVLIIAAAAYGTVQYRQPGGPPASESHGSIDADVDRVPGQTAATAAVNDDESTVPVPSHDSPVGSGNHTTPFPELDASTRSRASWINPLQSRLWLRDGWVLNESSMSAEQPAALATFLRPYRGLMVEFSVDHPEIQPIASDDESDTADSAPPSLILRLVTQDNQVRTSLELSQHQVSLLFHEDGAQQLVRTAETDSDLMHSRLWLTATPSRLMLRSDDHLLINAPRRGGGGELYFQLEAADPGLTLADMRFEGE